MSETSNVSPLNYDQDDSERMRKKVKRKMKKFLAKFMERYLDEEEMKNL